MLASIVSPTNGTHFQKAVGMELNIPLQAQVINPGPGATTVYFYANGSIVASAGSQGGYSSTLWSNVAFGAYTLLAGTGQSSPSSDPVNIYVDPWGVALVNENAIWKYLDGGADPGPHWFLPDADLSTWPSGLPQFGFGDNDERTLVNWYNPIDDTVYPAYYFRHAFIVTNATSYTNLVARLLRDDGAIVYLNGRELFRDNMPAGPINYRTYAGPYGIEENAFTDHWIDPAGLVDGTNHLAVEIHNLTPQSHDISFDLRLIANLPVALPRVALFRAGTNVITAWPQSYLGYHLETTTTLGTDHWDVITTPNEFRSTNSISAPARFFRLSL